MIGATSKERTLVLPEYSGNAAGLSWPLYWPSKDPQDALVDFNLDISGWLCQIEDNAITVVASWSPNNPGDTFVLEQAYIANNTVTVLASGGTPWFVYAINLTVTSQIKHQVLSRTISLPCEILYTEPSLDATSGSVSGVVQQ